MVQGAPGMQLLQVIAHAEEGILMTPSLLQANPKIGWVTKPNVDGIVSSV